MTPSCPSDMRLEAHSLDPSHSRVAGHVGTCESCEARLAALHEGDADFRTRLYPRTVDAVVARFRPRRPTWGSWLFAGLGLAATAAAVTLMWRPHPEEPGDVQTKGSPSARVAGPASPLSFDVYVADAKGVREATNGSRVAPDAQLRFTVSPPERCWFSVVSLDASGGVTRLYPAEPDGVEVPQPQLPGGAVLDGRAGPERLFALCSRNPLREAEVESAGRAAAAGDVRALTRIPGLPKDVLQSTLLLEKAP